MQVSTFRKSVLPNGLTLVAEQHKYVRSVSVGVWVRTGSAYEKASENGISHFIEHMVFKGTEKRTPLEIATILESLGGDLNAFTEREFTCYHATVLKEHLEVAIDAVSDLVLHPTFPDEQVERERSVLLQELSMIEDAPDDHIGDLLFQTVWKDQPLGRSIIGSRKTIRSISRSELVRYFATYYQPENIVVSVAGNFEFDELESLVRKYLVFSKPQKKTKSTGKLKSHRFHRQKRSLSSSSEQVHFVIGFDAVGFRDSFRFDALILSFFLGGGMSSRLFQEVREKAGLAYSIDCEVIPFSMAGLLTIYASVAPKSLAPCLEIISKEIQRLRERPLDKKELDLVKGQLKGTILLCADQMDTRQESLGRNEILFGRYISVDEVAEEIDRVTPERVHEVAKRIFQKERETMVTLSRSRVSPKELTIFRKATGRKTAGRKK